MRIREQLMFAGLVAANVAVWLFVRFVYLASFDAVAIWQGQMALAQGLLLLDTLVIVWRYTVAAEGQVALSREAMRLDALGRWQDNKPVVFTDRRDHPELGDGNFTYVVRNVGGGFAVNVFVLSGGPDSPKWESLGALSAGDERELAGIPMGAPGHVLLAEGVRTRTRRWNPTFNQLVRDGEIRHHSKAW